MLAFSGGPSSRCLLELYNMFQQSPRQRGGPHAPKVFGRTVAAHIDESGVSSEEKGERVADAYGFEFTSVRLEDAYDASFDGFGNSKESGTNTNVFSLALSQELLVGDISPRNERVGNLNHLRNALSALPKGTGREALVRQLRARLLVSMARTEGCDVLIFGDSMTRQAIRALTLTAEGRGFVMPEETAGVRADGDGKALETLVFLRPLRKVLSKEIGVYNWFKGLDTSLVLRAAMVSRHPIKGSIERLTEDFIVNLDKAFPSTVSTVARTISKVMTDAPDVDLSYPGHWKCPICFLPAQPNTADWTRRITVSREPGSSSTSVLLRLRDSDKRDAHSIDIDSYVCHGCRSTLSEALLGSHRSNPTARLVLPGYMANQP